MQDLNDMLFFAEVVDKGGFAAAGRALGVPKSKLSRRVAGLEARLGVRLLQRTTRKLSLTEAGELYHRHCAAIRDEAAAATDALAQVQQAPRGTVRMTCPITLAQSNVGRVIAHFLVLHPEVRVEMQVTNRVVDLVEEGVDVALRVRPTLEDSGSLVVKSLGRTSGVMVGAPALLAQAGPIAGVDDLQRLPTVAMGVVDGRASWRLVGPGGKEHMFVHRPRYVADDIITLKAAVMEGVGIYMLPDYLCSESLANGRLAEVLPGWAPAQAVVHAVFPSRRGLLPAVRRFLDFLGENVQGEAMAFGSIAPA
ncbi:LysR family transcriptional regulator [Ramlibacter sp.]|uniref:LysR family transcriptional regulator n=1 Tax=Ramlibacter sp. TaxID=1917967 RepID=UPI0018248C1D|nr:LysR family transcriptional regulator [Ramlibacter sp.]MBA2675045.1 LysR family transcriptional regulator [Ramlibacter sp.]